MGGSIKPEWANFLTGEPQRVLKFDRGEARAAADGRNVLVIRLTRGNDGSGGKQSPLKVNQVPQNLSLKLHSVQFFIVMTPNWVDAIQLFNDLLTIHFFKFDEPDKKA